MIRKSTIEKFDTLNIVSMYVDQGLSISQICKDNNGKTYQILLTNNVAYQCIDYLYKNSTMYLDRKYNRYLEFRRSYGKL